MTAKEWKDLYIKWRRLYDADPSITNVIHTSLRYKDLIGRPFKASYYINTNDAYLHNRHGFYIAFTIDSSDSLEHNAIFTVIRDDGLYFGERFISNDSDLVVKYPVLEELGKKMQEVINKYQSKEEITVNEQKDYTKLSEEIESIIKDPVPLFIPVCTFYQLMKHYAKFLEVIYPFLDVSNTTVFQLYINSQYMIHLNIERNHDPRVLQFDIVKDSKHIQSIILRYTADTGLCMVTYVGRHTQLEFPGYAYVNKARGLDKGWYGLYTQNILEKIHYKLTQVIELISDEEENEPMEEPTKMTFVTLCGSHRFYDEFIRIKNDMEKDGNTHVFIPEIFQFADPSKLDEKTHQRLDELHQAKMKQSDYVLIVNKDGYIGEDTKKEIEWCESNGIDVKYIEKPIEQLQTIFVTLNYFYTDDRVEVPIPIEEGISRAEFLRRLEATLKAFGDRWVRAYLANSQGMVTDAMVEEFNLQVKVSGGDYNEDT